MTHFTVCKLQNEYTFERKNLLLPLKGYHDLSILMDRPFKINNLCKKEPKL